MIDFTFELPITESFKIFVFGGTSLLECDFQDNIICAMASIANIGVVSSFEAQIEPPIQESEVIWNEDVWRGLYIRPCISSDDATTLDNVIRVRDQDATHFRSAPRIGWDETTKFNTLTHSKYVQSDPVWLHKYITYVEAIRVVNLFVGNSATATPYIDFYSLPHTTATPIDYVRNLTYVSAWPKRAFVSSFSQQATIELARRASYFNNSATPFKGVHCTRFTDTIAPEFIWPIPLPIEQPIDEDDDKYHGETDFNLTCLLPDPIWHSVKFNIGASNICQQALDGFDPFLGTKVFFVMFDMWIKVVSTQNLIPCKSISLNLDRDSWGWSWSAKVTDNHGELMASQQVVEIGINDYTWTGIVEKCTSSAAFGKNEYMIGGRSQLAELTSPYTAPRSRNETSIRSMVQLAEDEVFNTGWSIDWHPTILALDWAVPAGVFSYANKTPVDALRLITDSFGSTFRSKNDTKEIYVQPKYSVMPWDMAAATMDFTLPTNIIQDTSVAWRPVTLMRGVWVSGVNQGVRVKVYRTGTDGVPYQPMIVDPLITHVNAAIQRGQSSLASTGRRRDVTLKMPLLDAVGVLMPGDLVQVDEATSWRGYVDSVSIEGAFNSGVYQTVSIEHIEEF